MSAPAKTPATYADLAAVPPHLVAEILGGELLTHPRPAPRHGRAASRLGMSLSKLELGDDGLGREGSWVFIDEPELHFGSDVLVPDLAGWRKERFPPNFEKSYLEIVPDWICEVISPSTKRYDRGIKRNIYAEFGVCYLWLVDPDEMSLEVFQLNDKGQWIVLETFHSGDTVSAPPFEAISFPLSVLFPFDEPLPDTPAEG